MAPHEVPASFTIRLFLLFSFTALRDRRCSLYERVRSRDYASDIDHSCEHSVQGMICCYAGGKHLSQSWTCWVSDAAADSSWQDGEDHLESYHVQGTANVIGQGINCLGGD